MAYDLILDAQSLAAFLRLRRSKIPPGTERLGAYVRLPNRVGKPVTQEEIAEAIGVTRTWYSKLETSDDVHPSLALLAHLSSALMLKPSERANLFSLAISDLALSS
jgi:DNA-binding XRE family transcriptional regulator